MTDFATLLRIGRGLNFTLTTTLGAIDLLGEIAGGGTYASRTSKRSPSWKRYGTSAVRTDRIVVVRYFVAALRLELGLLHMRSRG